VVEIAESSSARDRSDEGAAYSSGGIPVYWIVNLIDDQIEVYTEPSPSGYHRRGDYKPGQDIPMLVNGVEQGRIAVADLLP
jgi:Uma2 family endonuclease